MRLDLLLSRENVLRMAEVRPVGDAWPYAGGTEQEIESHIQATVAALERVPGLIWESEFGHYGSGYASYVDVFTYRRDGHGTRQQGATRQLTGLRIYLSRVAPIACFGPAQVTRQATGGSWDFLTPHHLNDLPDPSWHDDVRRIRSILAEHQYEILERELAARDLDFEVRIPTMLNDGPFRYFDAVFFWED